MAAPKELTKLVENFDRNLASYTSGAYNEAQVRAEFIDPMFELLGWDVQNKAGNAEAYKDVVHEDAIQIGGTTKAPDYCFRIGGARKFFLEAKKPSVSIKNEPTPAYQLRRYAWSAKLPLSILSDFAELAVYDCRVKPEKTDKPAVARINYLTFKQYPERWDEIAGVFSKDAVLKGSFDRFAEEKKGKKGTAAVDAEFLKEIERWRELLARKIALRNPRLSIRELNEAVQRTIDRIVFLRICEDRGIETQYPLRGLQNGTNVYRRLFELFQRADERYNSGLFHFQTEKGFTEAPDTLTPGLKIDDKLLQDIIGNLYYPDSPYEFSVLPADILGQVYEQFLGKVIRLTKGHQAKVEDKPEVKKAGGVYYTPTYIVDYIVEHTVGELLKETTPKQATDLKILDPACGSGSFLLGAYQRLLDWHRDWYVNDGPEKHARPRKGGQQALFQAQGSEWRLTTLERKCILLNSIFGVDIDPQAVEVTKLSLLLKVLEGESEESINAQLKLFHQRALPDLASNIKCGNSLIGSDFFQGRQGELFDDEEALRVNPFDWDKSFAEIFARANPGFDAVIGNPPWLMAGYYLGNELDALRSAYKSAIGKFDLYYLFVERGMTLLSKAGRFGMIVPNKLFHTRAATALRSLLANACHIRQIVDFGDARLFPGATNYSCILILDKGAPAAPQYIKATRNLLVEAEFAVPLNSLGAEPWHFEEKGPRQLFERLERVGQPLEQLAERFGTGVQSGLDSVLAVDETKAHRLHLEKPLLRPVLRGRDVRRYVTMFEPKLLIFPYKTQQDRFVVLNERELASYPNAKAYLEEARQALSERIWFGKTATQLSGKWYGLVYLDTPSSFAKRHVLTPSLSDRANFTLGPGHLFATGTAGVTSMILSGDVPEDIRYVLGLLNSRLLSVYATRHSPVFSGRFYKFSAPYLRHLPIRRLSLNRPAEERSHNRMVELVNRMLALSSKLAAARTDHEKTVLQRQIDATDREIDALVYELYGLTDGEIRIVEEASK